MDIFLKSSLHIGTHNAIYAGNYDTPEIFEVFRTNMDSVMANAKLLDRMNEGITPSDSVPDTMVFELIEKKSIHNEICTIKNVQFLLARQVLLNLSGCFSL